jgi:hypothetical protein
VPKASHDVVTDGSTSSRRDFFGRAWHDALTTAPSVAPRLSAVATGIAGTRSAALVRDGEPPRVSHVSPPPPPPAAAGVSLDDVLAQSAIVGLERRASAIRALAQWSVRLTPAPAGRSRVGGRPGVLAQVDLASVAALGLETPLPVDGQLVFLADVVSWEARTLPDGASGQPLEASAELGLPRVWSRAVEAIDLDDAERNGWDALRVWLAAQQDVALHDRMSGFLALHRLLGYPDETSGDMPLRCELLASGAGPDERHPRMHPRARELEAQAPRWRLLLQLSPGGGDRLYFWITAEDLDAGDFTRVRAIWQ